MMTQRQYADETDAKLIRAYLQQGDQLAFKTLLDRYYGLVFSIVTRSLRGAADTEDLVQNVWFKVINSLSRYDDSGKFAAFVGTIARNEVTDYWRARGVRDKAAYKPMDEEEFNIEHFPDPAADTLLSQIGHEDADFLTTKLIPALPVEQRTVFLLKHESEWWEGQKRLDWGHLSGLNGIQPKQAWLHFESARAKLCDGRRDEVDAQELGVFLVWTQAQRLNKSAKYTENYFAELLGIPTNTLKTRYRTAIQTLMAGMKDRRLVA